MIEGLRTKVLWAMLVLTVVFLVLALLSPWVLIEAPSPRSVVQRPDRRLAERPGCRTADGGFDPESFRRTAAHPEVKMIEVKFSQGAKPGHGGILSGAKVTKEIAAARLVPSGVDVFSPTYHRAFSTPLEMMGFIAQLRELSDGKPVGFKPCVGTRSRSWPS